MAYEKKKKSTPTPPQPGWAVYLRTSSDENQKPEMSRARQKFTIDKNVLERSSMPVFEEYIDVLTGKTPNRAGYQRLLADARLGKFSHVIVGRADRFGRNDTEAMRAIVELTPTGKRKTNISSLSNIFHNWAYAGWIVSKPNQIAPKTLRGSWEPIVTTEELEQGQEILARRNVNRSVRRKQVYLLQGMIYYHARERRSVRLTCSTSNAGRSGQGTPYYRIPGAGEVSFLCRDIDAQVGHELMRIQVDPELMPIIRSAYTHELAQKLGYLRPDEKEQIRAALKSIDDEEGRTVRLLAAGKITETVWEGLWAEWQDRRKQLRQTLDTLDQDRAFHIDNLDAALQIIARIGTLYNELQQQVQKELLCQVVERVVVDHRGLVRLEMHAPFAYLKELTDEVRAMNGCGEGLSSQNKTGGEIVPASLGEKCSTWFQLS